MCRAASRPTKSIVKGERIEEPGIPASFRVLVKEMQSLGLAVEAITDTGEVLRFGKDEEKQKMPRLSMGLLGGLDGDDRYVEWSEAQRHGEFV